MPLGVKAECIKCNAKTCSIWKKSPDGILCNDCFNSSNKTTPPKTTEETAPLPKQENVPKIATRKSTRTTRSYKTRHNPYALPKPMAPKGKGRRVIFKKAVSQHI